MSRLLDIGVVTPTHPMRNGRMLERAAQSVWTQEHQASGHFVVCDWDKRGAAWTRQKALEANPFEWTAFLDSDDWFAPQHLAVLADAALQTGADYVYSWYWLATGRLGHEKISEEERVFSRYHFEAPWDPAKPRHTTITVLVKTALAREVGFATVGDDGEIAHRHGEDWNFTIGCNRLGTIHHVAERTWYWSHHGLNSSGIPGRGDA